MSRRMELDIRFVLDGIRVASPPLSATALMDDACRLLFNVNQLCVRAGPVSDREAANSTARDRTHWPDMEDAQVASESSLSFPEKLRLLLVIWQPHATVLGFSEPEPLVFWLNLAVCAHVIADYCCLLWRKHARLWRLARSQSRVCAHRAATWSRFGLGLDWIICPGALL